jgi:hypothetical protein
VVSVGNVQLDGIKRGSIRSAIGLEAESVDITWSPRNRTATGNIQNTSPYELARVGFFDNMRFRMWRTVMPTPGDADTFGAAEWFAGWIGDAQTQDGAIQFSINSYMYALNQKVPSGVIEVTNPVASYSGGVPPAGYTHHASLQGDQWPWRCAWLDDHGYLRAESSRSVHHSRQRRWTTTTSCL